MLRERERGREREEGEKEEEGRGGEGEGRGGEGEGRGGEGEGRGRERGTNQQHREDQNVRNDNSVQNLLIFWREIR